MRHAVVALLTLLMPGCYGLARGRCDVEVTSDPPGALVTFGEVEGVTPCVLSVPRSSTPRMIRFRLADRQGVHEEVVSVEDKLHWPMLLAVGDALLIVPLIVDLLVLEANYDWPTSIRATLAPEGRQSFVWIERD